MALGFQAAKEGEEGQSSVYNSWSYLGDGGSPQTQDFARQLLIFTEDPVAGRNERTGLARS